jgi:hypothetical protein
MTSAPIRAARHSPQGGGSSGGKRTCSSTPQIARLMKPQITLRIAEDSPAPRGEANGV